MFHGPPTIPVTFTATFPGNLVSVATGLGTILCQPHTCWRCFIKVSMPKADTKPEIEKQEWLEDQGNGQVLSASIMSLLTDFGNLKIDHLAY